VKLMPQVLVAHLRLPACVLRLSVVALGGKRSPLLWHGFSLDSLLDFGIGEISGSPYGS
jgi:hypothetical protein